MNCASVPVRYLRASSRAQPGYSFGEESEAGSASVGSSGMERREGKRGGSMFNLRAGDGGEWIVRPLSGADAELRCEAFGLDVPAEELHRLEA